MNIDSILIGLIRVQSTHWGQVTHICVSKLTIVGSDNGLSPGGCQAIISTNAEILLFEPLGTKFSEILIKIDTFSFKKNAFKIPSVKHFPHYWPFVWGIHQSPGNSLHKGQWRRALMYSLICAWINNWVNNGDLGCYHAHYDVTVMHWCLLV